MRFLGLGKKKAQSAPSASKTERRLDVASRLLAQGQIVARNVPEIGANRVYRREVDALARAVSALVTSICFTDVHYGDEPPFYSDVWTRNQDCFDDLAAFLSYWLVAHQFRGGNEERDSLQTADLMGVAATVFTASKRAQRLITRFTELMRTPDEIWERRILGVTPNSDETEARGIVFAYIVNETIGGPPLELDVQDGSEHGVAIDPAYALWLRAWMANLSIEIIQLFRDDAAAKRDIVFEEYLASCTKALNEANTIVTRIFG